MRISVIIPTYNEVSTISALVEHLEANRTHQLVEILVADGGSTDETCRLAQQAGAHVLVAPLRGRAQQMNFAASKAQGDVLYFVHADTIPPATYLTDIQQAVEADFSAGCYRSCFRSSNPLLRVNSYCTRFDRLMCRGGDQTLFVTKDLFCRVGGYDSCYVVMEDFDFIRRIQQLARFRIIPKDASVSARKYDHNSYWMVTLANLIVLTMFRWGYPSQTLLRTYKRLIYYPKYQD